MDMSPMDTDNFDSELCHRPQTDSFDLAPIGETTNTNEVTTTQPNNNEQPDDDDVDMIMDNKGPSSSLLDSMDIDEQPIEREEEQHQQHPNQQSSSSHYSHSSHDSNNLSLPTPSITPSLNINNNNSTSSQQQQSGSTDASLRPIAILIDELAREDLSCRLNAMRQLKRISQALGPNRTRNELIPYLTEMIDDDDEILMVMIESISELIPNLIGGRQFVANVLSPFERLCVVEEKMIRDVAVDKLSSMIGMMKFGSGSGSGSLDENRKNRECVVGLCRRLCESDWHTARMSGAKLIGKIYGHVSDEEEKSHQKEDDGFLSMRRELERMFEEACADDIPVVRRECVESIGEMVSCESVSIEEVKLFFIPLFRKLVNDGQDNVRVVCPSHVVSFGKRLSHDEIEKHLMASVIRPLINDQSWRVRYMVSCHYVSIVKMWMEIKVEEKSLKNEDDVVEEKRNTNLAVSKNLIDSYIRLLKDDEAEVRCAAVSQLDVMNEQIGDRLISIEKLVPLVTELCRDDNKHTRAALASVLMKFVCQFWDDSSNGSNDSSNGDVVVSELLPCVLTLLKDDFSTVRLHIISSFERGGSDVDEEEDDEKKEREKESRPKESVSSPFVGGLSVLSQSLVPAISQLCHDEDWRVRMAIMEKIWSLARHFGEEYFVCGNSRSGGQDEHEDEDEDGDVDAIGGNATVPSRVNGQTNLLDLCVEMLTDPVAAVRSCASREVGRKISSLFGLEFSREKIVNGIVKGKLKTSRHYLHRIVCCLTVFHLVSGYLVMEEESELRNGIIGECVSILVWLMEHDPVPNVRFKAMNVLRDLVCDDRMVDSFDRWSVVASECVGVIEKVSREDGDTDVKYFGRVAAHDLRKKMIR